MIFSLNNPSMSIHSKYDIHKIVCWSLTKVMKNGFLLLNFHQIGCRWNCDRLVILSRGLSLSSPPQAVTGAQSLSLWESPLSHSPTCFHLFFLKVTHLGRRLQSCDFTEEPSEVITFPLNEPSWKFSTAATDVTSISGGSIDISHFVSWNFFRSPNVAGVWSLISQELLTLQFVFKCLLC